MKTKCVLFCFIFLLLSKNVFAQTAGGSLWGHPDKETQGKGSSLLTEYGKKPDTDQTENSVMTFWENLIQNPQREQQPVPEPTMIPEPTEIPDPFAGVEIQKGVVWRSYKCGNDLNFTIIYQPIMTRVQSNLTADGSFILFRVQIQNLTDRPIKGLLYESFTLSKTVGGTETVYPLSGFFSTVTSTLWEIGLCRNEIPAKGMLDTYLVFDVEGTANDPWVLNFCPIERFTYQLFTPIRLTLPPVSAQ